MNNTSQFAIQWDYLPTALATFIEEGDDVARAAEGLPT